MYNMGNFCTNCGNKLRPEDNFCTNCGAKIDKSDLLNPAPYSMEKEKAKKELKRVIGGRLSYNKTFEKALIENGLDIYNTGKAIRQQVEKEIDSGIIKSGGVEFRVNQLIFEFKIKKEEEKKKLKRIDEIFESTEIKSEIKINKINQNQANAIKDSLKNRLINESENMSDGEIEQFIKTEFKKVAQKQEPPRIVKETRSSDAKIEESESITGGYCSLNCRHCYEEFLDSGGGIVGDYDIEGYVEYYCHLGHQISYGSYCEDYE